MARLNLIKYSKMKIIDMFASNISISLRKSVILLKNCVLNYKNNSEFAICGRPDSILH